MLSDGSPVTFHPSEEKTEILEIEVHVGIVHPAPQPVIRFRQISGIFGIIFILMIDGGAVAQGDIGIDNMNSPGSIVAVQQ